MFAITKSSLFKTTNCNNSELGFERFWIRNLPAEEQKEFANSSRHLLLNCKESLRKKLTQNFCKVLILKLHIEVYTRKFPFYESATNYKNNSSGETFIAMEYKRCLSETTSMDMLTSKLFPNTFCHAKGVIQIQQGLAIRFKFLPLEFYFHDAERHINDQASQIIKEDNIVLKQFILFLFEKKFFQSN